MDYLPIEVRNPPGYRINRDVLQKFESGLDTFWPERSRISCKVLGYGEISTVFEIDHRDFSGLAVKRMSVFETDAEVQAYLSVYQEYNHVLEELVGVNAPRHGHAIVTGSNGRPIFYILQEKAPVYAIGNQVLRYLREDSLPVLVETMLAELLRVYRFSRDQQTYEIGVDGQISNWIVRGFDPEQPAVHPEMTLEYLDNSTPFLRVNGVEQMDAEIFLRPAPSFLSWILRLYFLEDVVNRYYDLRSVIVDLIANFHKEQMPEAIPGVVKTVNDFLAGEAADFDLEPIREEEVKKYYREDVLIWRLYLGMRRVDRLLHRISGRVYNYILPGRMKR